MYAYMVADPAMLDDPKWEVFFTLHLRTATLLKQELVKEGLMKAQKQRFHWGVGFSQDAEKGFRTSSCANMEISYAAEDPRRLPPWQHESFAKLMHSLQ